MPRLPHGKTITACALRDAQLGTQRQAAGNAVAFAAIAPPDLQDWHRQVVAGVVLPGLGGGDCSEIQGLPVSDRGHRACGVAISPFRAESARRRGVDGCRRCGGHLRDDPVLVCKVRAGATPPVGGDPAPATNGTSTRSS
jgi:hypothetical protein